MSVSARPGRTPRPSTRKPKRQRRGDQIGGREHVHRQKEYEAAKSGAGEVGEIDAAENAVAPEKDASEEKRAGQERRQLRQENRQKLPLLRRVGDQEDRVEAEMLHIKVGGDGERPEQSERNGRGPRQLRANQSLATVITALARPKPSIARLTTSEPKCAQLPTAKTRMMSICSAITEPAPRPTAR